MGLNAKVGSFNIGLGAAASTVVVNDVGFTPKAIIFWWSGRTEAVDTAGAGDIKRGMGFATSNASFRAISTHDPDGVATSTVAEAKRNDACILECEDVSGTTPTMIGWADIQSMDAGGFTLEILDAFVTNLRIHYLALGGSDIDAEIITWTPAGTAPVNQIIATTLVPKALIHMGIRTSNAAATFVQGASHALFSFNTATGAYQWSGGATDASGTGSNISHARMGEVVGSKGSSGTASATGMENRATVVSLDTSPVGFTINWLERALANPIYTLVLSGSFKTFAGSTLSSTSGGIVGHFGDFDATIQPYAGLFVSHCKAADATDVTTIHEHLSIGAADGVSQVCHSYSARHGNTTIFTNTAVSFDSIYMHLDETNDASSGGVLGEFALNSFQGGGMDFNSVDPDTAPALVGYIIFAPAGYILNTTIGAVGITGTAAGVNFGRALTAQAGAIDISAVDASLLFKRSLTASAGAVDIGTPNTTLSKGMVVTASAGAVPIVGVSPALLYKTILAVQAGAVPIAGVGMSLLRGGMILSAQVGAVPVVGENVDLMFGYGLVAQLGSCPIVGVSPTLWRSRAIINDNDAAGDNVPIVGGLISFVIYVLQFYSIEAIIGVVPVNSIPMNMIKNYPMIANAGVIPMSAPANTMFFKRARLVAQTVNVPIISSGVGLIGVEPGAHSTDVIYISLSDLHHHIGA